MGLVKATLMTVDVADTPNVPSIGTTDITEGGVPGSAAVEDDPPPPHAVSMMSGNEQKSISTKFFISPPFSSQALSL
jgi:hypothetical protein